MLAIPPIIIVLVVLAVFSSSPTAAMVTLGSLGRTGPGAGRPRGHPRGPRGAVRHRRQGGRGPTRRASWPPTSCAASSGPILAQATVFAGVTLAVQAALAFLGLLSSRRPDLGRDDRRGLARSSLRTSWLLIPPGVGLCRDRPGPRPARRRHPGPSPPARPPTTAGQAPLAHGCRGPRHAGRPGARRRTSRRRRGAAASGASLEVHGVTAAGPQPSRWSTTPPSPSAPARPSVSSASPAAARASPRWPCSACCRTGVHRVRGAGDLPRRPTCVAGGAAAYRAVRGSGIGYVAQDALGQPGPDATPSAVS